MFTDKPFIVNTAIFHKETRIVNLDFLETLSPTSVNLQTWVHLIAIFTIKTLH